jgi:hypothetical protein
VARPLGHLFGRNVTRVAFKRGAYLRHFVYAFAELLSDRLEPRLIQRAMTGDSDRLRPLSLPDLHEHHAERTPALTSRLPRSAPPSSP